MLFPVGPYFCPHGGVKVRSSYVVADPRRSYERIYPFHDEASKELAIVAARAGLPAEVMQCNAVLDGDMVRITGPSGATIAGFFRSDLPMVHQLSYHRFAEKENANAQSNSMAHQVPSTSARRES